MDNLKTSEMSSVKMVHFDGPKKPVPPEVTYHIGQTFELVSKTATVVRSALDSDVQWIAEVVESTHGANPTSEWSGAMASSAREMGNVPGVATQFVFGPLIDSPPAHPDTVLTTLVFIEDFMKQHNVPYIYLQICSYIKCYCR